MKDPAFLFYSKDWLEGTAELMPDEKGIFIDLLAHQHQKGNLPTETKRLSRLVGLSEENFIPIWNEIKHKFEQEGNRTVNRKLEQVVTERYRKGRKNKLIGTFAHVLKKLNLNKTKEKELKKLFKVDELLESDTEWTTERLTEWCKNSIPLIEDANANEDQDKFSFKRELIKIGVEEKVASDWLKVRRTKKAANTETAFNGIKSQIEKSGLTANECIKISAEKSWSGFNHKWLKNTNVSFNPSDTRTQPDMENFDGNF